MCQWKFKKKRAAKNSFDPCVRMMASGNRPEVQEGLCRLTIITTRVPDMRDKSVVKGKGFSQRISPVLSF
jgi:hypothetical protein